MSNDNFWFRGGPGLGSSNFGYYQKFEKQKKISFFWTKMAVKAFRDSSGVDEAQHTWFTTAKRLLNNRSAAEAAVAEAQRIVCVCRVG